MTTTGQGSDELFLSEGEFERLLRMLEQHKNLLLTGYSGVGKSLIARRLAAALTGDTAGERIETIQFHRSYSFDDFVHGYRPSPNGMELRDGMFPRFCREALKDPDRKYAFVIDELNRCDAAAVFGEILTLLETDKRRPEFAMPLLYVRLEGERFYVPPNVYVVATMNPSLSAFPADAGVLGRFAISEIHPAFGSESFLRYLKARGLTAPQASQLAKAASEVNAKLHGLGFQIGHGPFCTSAPMHDEPWQVWYTHVVEHRILPQIKGRLAGDASLADEIARLLRLPQ